jgi:hypothetical protein
MNLLKSLNRHLLLGLVVTIIVVAAGHGVSWLIGQL